MCFISFQKNIVHRDLKLGNMVLNKRSRRITITNFCLGKHLVSENDLLLDQRGSPAYISPDVLSGKLSCLVYHLTSSNIMFE
jgi:serine/threonine-protein kinase 40